MPVTGSCSPKSHTWYVPPRCRMPVRSFGACFLRAMRGSLSSGIGQSVGQRSKEDHQARSLTQGATIEECRERAAEAIEVHIAGLEADGEPVPEERGMPQLLTVTIAA
ncbi:MAG: type II toxin-antitoxin system HicB family antitoxin [Pseudonocardiaceae bacterium]